MDRMKLKITVGAVLVLGAMGLLVSSAFQESMTYYYTVDEFFEMKHANKLDTRRGLKVSGIVLDDSIHKGPGPREIRFDVGTSEQAVHIRYSGVVPDTFKEGREVVVTGKISDDGSIHATELLAKCPSKYESEEGGEPGQQHPDEVPLSADA